MASNEGVQSVDVYSEENADLCLRMLRNRDTFNVALARYYEWIKQGHIADNPNMFCAFMEATSHHVRDKVQEFEDYKQEIQEKKDAIADATDVMFSAIREGERLLQLAVSPENYELLTEAQKKDIMNLMQEQSKDSRSLESRNEEKAEEELKANLQKKIRSQQRKILHLREQLSLAQAKTRELSKSEEEKGN